MKLWRLFATPHPDDMLTASQKAAIKADLDATYTEIRQLREDVRRLREELALDNAQHRTTH